MGARMRPELRQETGGKTAGGTSWSLRSPKNVETPGQAKACPTSHEVVFDLVEKPFFGGRVVHRQGLAQLLHQFLLVARQPRGNLHIHMHVEVAPRAAVHHRHTLVPQPELRAALRAFGNLELVRLIERGHLDFRAQRRLRQVDGNGAMQILPLALEEGVLLDLEEDVEIARRSPVRAGLAFRRQPYAGIVIDSRRNRNLEFALDLPEAVAAALAARVANDLARPAAGAASAPDGEETLLIQNLTAAVACGALRWSAAGLRSRAAAPVAAIHARHLDVGVHPEHRLFKRQLQVVAHILAALRAVAARM